jgi:hypothetical protein
MPIPRPILIFDGGEVPLSVKCVSVVTGMNSYLPAGGYRRFEDLDETS